jgi:ABC-2 type transport system ATP-binding protein
MQTETVAHGAEALARAPVLELRHVSRRYGRLVALDDVGFAVAEGQFIGLLGPNGAGKSTLASLVAGLEAPDRGEIELFGRALAADRLGVLERIGVVFQSRSLDPEMRARANLAFHAALFGISGAAFRRRLDELADLLGIGDLLERPVGRLSGGNQRRIEIARALLNRPRLALMDEASAGLDAAARAALLAHLRRLCTREGTAILWATHLLDEVEDAARLIVLDHGRVVADSTPQELRAASGATTLLAAYLALTGSPAPA